MNRKTNLFYNSGPDSNFLTFSNYTEALTGNIIATNAKLFPAKFICLYIPELEEADDFTTEKETFIKQYLVSYYENKLATLRDKAKDENIKTEEKLNPLDYLLKTIKKYSEAPKITHIGYICEQEYNGTFMDNICIIEASEQVKEYLITDGQPTQNDTALIASNPNNTKLHGWESYTNDFLNGYTPSYDNNNAYSSDTSIALALNNDPSSAIEFNVLIPLFNIYNWDGNSQDPYYYNPSGDETMSENIDDSGLFLNSAATRNQYDIPLGIWISNKKITLERTDNTTGEYNPSWSLCISSQFKPFPYSNNMPNEIDGSGNVDIYGSFAMIMAKQGYILDEFESLNESISALSARLDNLTTIVNNLEIQANGGTPVDDEGEEMSMDDIQNAIDNLGSQVNSLSSEISTVNETLGSINPTDIENLHDAVFGDNGDGIYYTVNGFNSRINSVEGTVTTVSNSLSALTDTVNDQGNTISSISTKALTAYSRTNKMIGDKLQWSNNYLRFTDESTTTNLTEILDELNDTDTLLGSRISEWDGVGKPENYPYLLTSIASTFGAIENKLNDLRAILMDAASNGGTINTSLSGHEITGNKWADASGDQNIGQWLSSSSGE